MLFAIGQVTIEELMQGLEEHRSTAGNPAGSALTLPSAPGVDGSSPLQSAGVSGPWMAALLADEDEEAGDAMLASLAPSPAETGETHHYFCHAKVSVASLMLIYFYSSSNGGTCLEVFP